MNPGDIRIFLKAADAAECFASGVAMRGHNETRAGISTRYGARGRAGFGCAFLGISSANFANSAKL
jgi:hypothetical protein